MNAPTPAFLRRSRALQAPALPLRLIGVRSALGAADLACADAPLHLSAVGLAERLAARGLEAEWAAMLDGVRRAGEPATRAVCRLADELAAAVARTLRDGCAPLVLGGDHSCAMGTWRGAAAAAGDAIGLLWIDAHLDAHTAATTPSGRLHGMPLAALLGHGADALCGQAAAVSPEHVAIVGVRSYEPDEAELLARIGVRVYAMDEIAARGLHAVLDEALARVRAGTQGYGISLDLDAIDPAHAPGVSTPVPGGLDGDALVDAFDALAGNAPPLALEIVEYDPRGDVDGRTARLLERAAAAAFGAVVRS